MTVREIDLHPQFVERAGKREFVVLPYEEYLALRSELEDLEDALALNRAREENRGASSYTIDEVRESLDLDRSGDD